MSCFVPNKMTQPGIPYPLAEGFQLFVASFGDQFDTPIRQVPDGACDFVSRGDGAGGVPETHTLHAA